MRALGYGSFSFLIAVILGCGASGSGAHDDPPREPQTVISPGPGGGTNVEVNGHDVWPPQGPGCERSVACCDAAAQVDSSSQLMCQLSAAADGFDCNAGLATMRTYLGERGVAVPAACAQ